MSRRRPGLDLDYEAAVVLRNLVHDHNERTDRADWLMVDVERRLEAVIKIAPVNPPSWRDHAEWVSRYKS